jgi:hypothetical protein
MLVPRVEPGEEHSKSEVVEPEPRPFDVVAGHQDGQFSQRSFDPVPPAHEPRLAIDTIGISTAGWSPPDDRSNCAFAGSLRDQGPETSMPGFSWWSVTTHSARPCICGSSLTGRVAADSNVMDWARHIRRLLR